MRGIRRGRRIVPLVRRWVHVGAVAISREGWVEHVRLRRGKRVLGVHVVGSGILSIPSTSEGWELGNVNLGRRSSTRYRRV